MNLNDFAKIITLEEGLKKSLSIAQVKEVLRITLTTLANMSYSEMVRLLSKYEK
jgi:hypothetical protein